MKVKKQPPSNDPVWASRCEPLRQYLAEPRNWADMKAWQKQRRVCEHDFRNELAYLENTRKVCAFQQKGVFHWVQVDHKPMLAPAEDDEALLRRLLPDAHHPPIKSKTKARQALRG